MERCILAERLVRASNFCVEFTKDFVLDALPDDFRYFVLLNPSSHNAKRPGECFVTFPGDRTEYAHPTGPIDADQVVSVIWREGGVPQWIDISVWGTDQRSTYFRLLCAGCFTAHAEHLYYTWNGWRDLPVAPFGVKGPSYPNRLALAAMHGEPIEKFLLAESCPDFPLR